MPSASKSFLTCPCCAEGVSAYARACPHCGHPIRGWFGFIDLAIIVAGGVFCALVAFGILVALLGLSGLN